VTRIFIVKRKHEKFNLLLKNYDLLFEVKFSNKNVLKRM
jgi:hypothetical protein